MSLNLTKTFKTDKKKETEGVWIDLEDGAAVKIRRFNYPPAQKFLQNRLKPHRQAIALDAFPEENMNKIFAEALAKFLIVEWKNISYGKDESGNDKPLSCTEGNVLLVCKELPELRDMLIGYARSVELYKVDEEEAEAKN